MNEGEKQNCLCFTFPSLKKKREGWSASLQSHEFPLIETVIFLSNEFLQDVRKACRGSAFSFVQQRPSQQGDSHHLP